MNPSVTRSYVDGLFVDREYGGLVWLSSAICGSEDFAPRHPTYGIPRSLFLFVECLAWFAQGIRSGVSTYFEATPLTRQQEMLTALRELAPKGFDEQYCVGMSSWTNAARVAGVDKWLQQNDDGNNTFLWRIAEQNRALIDALLP
jgi:hypothetical protein